uniref:Uncharacterized protein n=1 Tax=Timema douglasi TaxID=61478 RepID=A0A7R8VIG1_TIMDO|nr:unnamed protein product [Timema douglasi]
MTARSEFKSHSERESEERFWNKRNLNTPYRDSNLNLTFIGCIAYCEGSALDHAATEQLVDDDGSVETALINYLFAKQVVNRLRSQMDVSDLQRKRSYWKQCAFNAVSCGRFRSDECYQLNHAWFHIRWRDLPFATLENTVRNAAL